jgi:hypothetical protein
MLMKKILFLSLGLLSLAMIGTTYANEVQPVCNNTGAICQLRQQMHAEIDAARIIHQTEMQWFKDQVSVNKATIEANRTNFHANFSTARSYLAKPLTGEKRQLVNEIIQAKNSSMEALQTTTNALIHSWTVDRSGYITQATTIITTFRSALLPYIDTAKLTQFDAFIQAKIDTMIANVAIKQTNTSLRMVIDGKRVFFKDRLTQKKADYKDIIDQMKQDKGHK